MGDISCNKLMLPRGPGAPISGPASKAPGCLGTFPNKCARAASLSGKHRPPPHPNSATAIPANSTQWELCGASVWPGSLDT
jgi:hypothetical protein